MCWQPLAGTITEIPDSFQNDPLKPQGHSASKGCGETAITYSAPNARALCRNLRPSPAAAAATAAVPAAAPGIPRFSPAPPPAPPYRLPTINHTLVFPLDDETSQDNTMTGDQSGLPSAGTVIASGADEFWLFGYGSLIWKPPPHFDRRVPGYVTGYVRRFWQASEDHRGTPEAPGRVVTLIERDFWTSIAAKHGDTAPERVWGVAYRIRADKVAEVKDYLDIREINGYTIHYADFQPASAGTTNGTTSESGSKAEKEKTIKTLVYIGTPTNPQFTGYQEPQGLAEHIYRSKGPSGTNREYLLNLEIALEALAPPESGDAHITDLCDRIRKIDRDNEEETAVDGGGESSSGTNEVGKNNFRRRGSVIEQEETEK